jgi:dipeptidyl aminopeptidase/acylaminoacyl peptidase
MEDLWIVEVGRRNERRLTHDGASINGVAWMPATAEVLFSSSRAGTSRLWRLSLAEHALPRLAAGLPDGAVDPAYAPMARRLAFERRTFDTNVRRLALDGSRTASAQPLAASTRWDAQPTLAAAGRLALVSDRGGPPALWVGWVARPRELRPLLESRIVGRPAWSPDGRRLAVAELRHGQADVVVVDVASGRRWRAAATAANEVSPGFDPDGHSVLYSSDAGGSWRLWRVRESQHATPMPRLGDEGLLGARVHGGAIFFVRPGSTGVWRAPLAAGTPARVPGTEELDPWADWDVADGTLFVRPLASEGREAYAVAIGAAASPSRVVVTGLPPAPFPGLGLAVDPAAKELLFGALDGSDGDLLRVEGYR